jgi:ribosomal protein L4
LLIGKIIIGKWKRKKKQKEKKLTIRSALTIKTNLKNLKKVREHFFRHDFASDLYSIIYEETHACFIGQVYFHTLA